ncbi:hypothetical protein GDO81_006684 [Engystomops pustulosus]|uniref:Uncharacterized protein n=1 Tax=Engystomops pustulosus TaxID=76066 RepID=A0AAV7D076_ENGPU|nr:hypothetical protein GDO81_006684 [Engystomops pustulosus]
MNKTCMSSVLSAIQPAAAGRGEPKLSGTLTAPFSCNLSGHHFSKWVLLAVSHTHANIRCEETLVLSGRICFVADDCTPDGAPNLVAGGAA